jgi:hypothetical protein
MFEVPSTEVVDIIIDLPGPARHKCAKQRGANLEHCHGTFLAERQRVVVCAGAAGLRMLPRFAFKEPARRRARLDGRQRVRRLGCITSAALAGRRLEPVAVTGPPSAEFS